MTTTTMFRQTKLSFIRMLTSKIIAETKRLQVYYNTKKLPVLEATEIQANLYTREKGLRSMKQMLKEAQRDFSLYFDKKES